MIYFRGLFLDFAGFFSYLETVIYWSSQPQRVWVIKNLQPGFPNLALTLQVKSRGGHTHTHNSRFHEPLQSFVKNPCYQRRGKNEDKREREKK